MSTTLTASFLFAGSVQVTATSDLPDAVVYFHWYRDGIYAGKSTGAGQSQRVFTVEGGAGGGGERIDCVDTADAGFDPLASPPPEPAARRLLTWIRSLDVAVGSYRLEQQKNGGAWTAVAITHQDPARWQYAVLSPRLEDLATYAWRVVAIDLAGNAGTPLVLGAEKIVRRPDAPAFTLTFDGGTGKVTVA